MDLVQPRLQVVRLKRIVVLTRRERNQQQLGLPERLVGHRLLVREGQRADELRLPPVRQRLEQPQRILRPTVSQRAPGIGRRRSRQRQG